MIEETAAKHLVMFQDFGNFYQTGTEKADEDGCQCDEEYCSRTNEPKSLSRGIEHRGQFIHESDHAHSEPSEPETSA